VTEPETGAKPAEPAPTSADPELVFTDEVGGKPIDLDRPPPPEPAPPPPRPAPVPQSARRARGGFLAGPETSTATRACGGCSHPVPDDYMACPSCGKVFVADPPPPDTSPPVEPYVPEGLAAELHAHEQELEVRDDAWRAVKRGNRWRHLGSSVLVLALPFALAVLIVLPPATARLVVGGEFLVAAVFVWIIYRRGQSKTLEVLFCVPWLVAHLAFTRDPINFLVLASAGLVTITLASAVGSTMTLGHDEIRDD
jgi:hypothetical protein